MVFVCTAVKDYFSNFWLTAILIDPELTGGITKDDIRLKLDSENIESRPLWKPMHQQPIFKDVPSYINGVSDDLFERGLCLPSGSNLSQNQLNKIISIIKSYF